MKIKLKDLWIAKEVFNKIFNTQYEDIKTTYWLHKITKKINPELEEIDKHRMELVKKHTNKDKTGKPIFKNNNYDIKDWNEFNKEWIDLLEQEIDLEEIEIKLSILQEAKLSVNDLFLLEKVVKLDDEEKKETKKS